MAHVLIHCPNCRRDTTHKVVFHNKYRCRVCRTEHSNEDIRDRVLRARRREFARRGIDPIQPVEGS